MLANEFQKHFSANLCFFPGQKWKIEFIVAVGIALLITLILIAAIVLISCRYKQIQKHVQKSAEVSQLIQSSFVYNTVNVTLRASVSTILSTNIICLKERIYKLSLIHHYLGL